MVFSESDLIDLVMQGRDLLMLDNIVVEPGVTVNFDGTLEYKSPNLISATDDSVSVEEFHQHNQQNWHMPQEYRDIDIAAYILGLCKTDQELQRVGKELMLYMERDLFDLLRYLRYLVDVMRENNIIWGVGRGSSVASYVLYLLGVHRVDSIYYDLDPAEFLR